jgi:hypothetical protein
MIAIFRSQALRKSVASIILYTVKLLFSENWFRSLFSENELNLSIKTSSQKLTKMSSSDTDDSPPEYDIESGNEVPEDPIEEPIFIHKKKKIFKMISRTGEGLDKPGNTCQVHVLINESEHTFKLGFKA